MALSQVFEDRVFLCIERGGRCVDRVKQYNDLGAVALCFSIDGMKGNNPARLVIVVEGELFSAQVRDGIAGRVRHLHIHRDSMRDVESLFTIFFGSGF